MTDKGLLDEIRLSEAGCSQSKLSYIFKTLKANNITELEVNFDGHSDDGHMRFTNAVGDPSKVKEITLYNEVSPNTFLDEPTPFASSQQFGEMYPDASATLCDIIWESVYSIFDYKDISWCGGRGNKGYLKFNSFKNKVEIKYLKYVESYDEITFNQISGNIIN